MLRSWCGAGVRRGAWRSPWACRCRRPVTGLVVFFAAGFLAFTCAFSVWLLNAVYELDEARETRARLAVAEERLRFGRDLHDVMGRNLAVIALKSELAVQLARRGRPEAVDQMIEVQRIAQESQREVRDVVRGYREADLGVELRVRGRVDGRRDHLRGDRGSGTGCPLRCSRRSAGWCGRRRRTCCGTGTPGGARWRLRVGGARGADRGERRGRAGRGCWGRCRLRSGARAVAGAGRGPGSPGCGSGCRRGRTLEAGRGAGEDRFRVVAEVPLPAGSGAGPDGRMRGAVVSGVTS